MKDDEKSVQQLIEELNEARARLEQTEASLRELSQPESKYREILSSLSDPAYVIQDGTIQFINSACLKLFGYSGEEEGLDKSNPIGSYVYPEDQEIVSKYYLRRLQGDITPHKYEFRVFCKDGSLKWIELKTTMIMWGGKPAGLAIAADISGSKRLEEALRDSEAKYRLLADNARDAIWQLDLDLIFTYVNPAIVEMSGFPASEWIGSRLSDHCDEQNFTKMSQLVSEEIARGDDARGFCIEAELIKMNKEPFTAEIVGNILRDEKGIPIGLQGVTRDISDRKRSEEARIEMHKSLVQAQKLESLSVMAAGIAHDFNNQLMAILGNLELALEDLPTESQTHRFIVNAVTAAQRSAELSTQMLAYTGSLIYRPVKIDLNELVTRNLALFNLWVSEHVNLRVKTLGGLPCIDGDEAQIRRLIANIISNASDAIASDAGEIQITTGIMNCDKACLSRSRLLEKPSPGRFVYVEVADSGSGMDAETIQKMFDPFFSTKFAGRGLGLAEAMGTVKSHRGAIMVNSQLGTGTTVRVLFPVSLAETTLTTDTVRSHKPQESGPCSVTDRKTVLIVDDEELVRDMVAAWLRYLGHDVIEAENGEQAVGIVRERLDKIDLVILDFVMPKMNGVEAFREMVKIREDIKVILSSGYAEDDVMANFGDHRPAGVLHKPYKMARLKDELARLL